MNLVTQLLKSERVFRDVVSVTQVLVDDDVHHGKRQSRIGSGIDRQVPVSTFGRTRAVGINDDKFCACASRLFNEWPEVDIVAVNVRAPRDDVA